MSCNRLSETAIIHIVFCLDLYHHCGTTGLIKLIRWLCSVKLLELEYWAKTYCVHTVCTWQTGQTDLLHDRPIKIHFILNSAKRIKCFHFIFFFFLELKRRYSHNTTEYTHYTLCASIFRLSQSIFEEYWKVKNYMKNKKKREWTSNEHSEGNDIFSFSISTEINQHQISNMEITAT